MTKEAWRIRASFFLEAHGVTKFSALEICPVGKTKRDSDLLTAVLLAPEPELLLNALKLIDVLLWLRSFEGKAPIGVNSWFRSRAYNLAVGGGKKSMHLTCGASDVTKAGWKPRRVAEALLYDYPQAHLLGIGLYKTFVHVDIRGMIGRRAPARWPGDGVDQWWTEPAA